MSENTQICQNIKFERGISNVADVQGWFESHPNSFSIVTAGRSNVGKSSLINVLFKKNIARTSKTPGRTREINVFSFTPLHHQGEEQTSFFLYDLPGYGFASVSKEMKKEWNKLLQSFFLELSHQHACLLSIQDARHPNTQADLQFTDFIQAYGLDTYLVYNKIDKLKTQKERAQLNKQKKSIFEAQKHVKQIYFVSSINKKGLPELALSLNSLMAGEVL